MSIVELRQTAENEWKPKYQGNYGLYTIKITTDGEKTVKFSCSCPSDYYPCKHIPIVERAIAQKNASGIKQGKTSGINIEKTLGNVSAERLRSFIAKQAKYNGELESAVFLEFSASVKNTEINKYSEIIQKSLASLPIWDDGSYYYEEVQDIDALDNWFDKAREYIGQGQYDETILICKACIEEFSQWLYNASEETSTMFYGKYQSAPFDILESAAKHANKKKLFDYCISEMKKKKYAGTDFYDGFHRLLATLALKVDPDAFIALQDQLLANIADKSSGEAETVLRRKIDFFRRLGQAVKAQALLEENMQINSFRLEIVEKKIAKHDFGEAKKLISDFLLGEDGQEHYLHRTWYKLLLDIAQKEDDIPSVRKLAYRFIKDSFQQEFYEIYKAAFTHEEWACEREKLLIRYNDSEYFRDSAASLLAAESDAKRLMLYIEKHLSPERLAKYYKAFESAYPEETLDFFEQAIVRYAENNVGRSHYEYVFSLLKKMSKVKGGKKEASDLAAVLRIRYKNRRAMLEILQRL